MPSEVISTSTTFAPQRHSFPQLLALGLGLLSIGLFYTAASLYFYVYRHSLMPFSPVVWIVAIGVGGLPLALFRRNWAILWGSGIGVWGSAFIVLNVVGFLRAGSRDEALLELAYGLVTVFLMVVFILMDAEEPVQRLLAQALAAGVLFAVGMNAVDVIKPGTFSASFGRAAGLYVNPNISAFAITNGMVASIRWISVKRRSTFLATCFIGVLMTLSRGGIVAFMLAALILVVGRVINVRDVARRGVLLIVISLGVLSLTGVGNALVEVGGVVEHRILQRLQSVNTGEDADGSIQGRADVAHRALEIFSQHSLLGAGLGVTRAWELREDTHDIYLKHLAEFGILGAALFPAFALLLRGRSGGEVGVIGWAATASLLFTGLVSHNVLDDRSLLFCAAFVAAMVTRERLQARVGGGVPGI